MLPFCLYTLKSSYWCYQHLNISVQFCDVVTSLFAVNIYIARLLYIGFHFILLEFPILHIHLKPAFCFPFFCKGSAVLKRFLWSLRAYYCKNYTIEHPVSYWHWGWMFVYSTNNYWLSFCITKLQSCCIYNPLCSPYAHPRNAAQLHQIYQNPHLSSEG